jgi:anti-sigma regulatory factor (Ser/Thr protein kinase)
LEFFLNSKTAGERTRLLAAFEQFARANHLSDAVRKSADLAIEEAVTNVLSYAFTDQEEHTIVLKFAMNGSEFVVEISDDGRAFDPTKFPTPNLKTPATSRAVGGLGIHMMRQSMDAIDYERIGGRNILRMRKQLKG